MSAAEDMRTQVARGWCAEWDRTGSRSVGVLTKADLCPPDALLNRLLDLGSNAANFRLGIVAVRNPSADTTPETCCNEDEFFAEWKEKLRDPSLAYHGSYGIDALIAKLVAVQTEGLRSTLPHLLRDLKAKLNTDLQRLQKLPKCFETTTECISAALGFIHKLTSTIRAMGDARYPAKDFHYNARLMDFFAEFAQHI